MIGSWTSWRVCVLVTALAYRTPEWGAQCAWTNDVCIHDSRCIHSDSTYDVSTWLCLSVCVFISLYYKWKLEIGGARFRRRDSTVRTTRRFFSLSRFRAVCVEHEIEIHIRRYNMRALVWCDGIDFDCCLMSIWVGIIVANTVTTSKKR